MFRSTDSWPETYADEIKRLTMDRVFAAGLVYIALHVIAETLVVFGQAQAPIWLSVSRIVAVTITVACVVASRWSGARRFAFLASVIVTWSTVALVIATIPTHGISRAGIDFVFLIICTGLFFPYSAVQMTLVGGSIVVTSLLVFIASDAATTQTDIPSVLFWVGSAALVATVASHLSLQLRRAESRERHDRKVAQEQVESLLLNILPEPIVHRLRETPGVIVNEHTEATVLFADVVGFTPLTSRLEPTVLVEILNRLFSAFDEMASRFGLEKIKTIGDAYMAAAGLPVPCADHAQRSARMALSMREFVDGFVAPDGTHLQVRIGLNSGPVVAGVIGTHKFCYDLWGDTVNTASRMESHATVGTIHLTESTKRHLEGEFCLESRGEIEVKGKGTMKTWVLKGPGA